MKRTEIISEALETDYVTVVALGDSITSVNHWTFGGLKKIGLGGKLRIAQKGNHGGYWGFANRRRSLLRSG